MNFLLDEIGSWISHPLTLLLFIVFFAVGYYVRNKKVIAQKRRILSLENEMLNNHKRILTLEKKLTMKN